MCKHGLSLLLQEVAASQFVTHATSRQTFTLAYGPGWNGSFIRPSWFYPACGETHAAVGESNWLDGTQFPGPSLLRQPDWSLPSKGWASVLVAPQIDCHELSTICLWCHSQISQVQVNQTSGHKVTPSGSSLINNVWMTRAEPNSSSNFIIFILLSTLLLLDHYTVSCWKWNKHFGVPWVCSLQQNSCSNRSSSPLTSAISKFIGWKAHLPLATKDDVAMETASTVINHRLSGRWTTFSNE